ncbi:hypothetical protein EMIHUDRAFT_251709 [Emiliania huxleyi CCMP1516]|uniref:USP domain-containing protein n=2 Tax=Emiliania huxleyi TaxID=2903 RepID=A0A0D3IN13_EMIH1|nr:hypothetical protein EMIHUDRAFT_213396 [Emiliania huxleyi CCMP1516]XP_005791120.1 hypothetical protein EMIHUDRAFT_251709 [Emiliania huxleyi CCMP1516]EOD12648.1 hypothetical protein EMIHUDRAFT_213396 [Emiliania huxleyi CCMP1516]EOD38691.1 hypothetical protein EMIHUDRAFT_251709 [Emiliania huxleyi CCMP1516]|eukprot:XP_005765077.1 hypothetical protein EMIHUDRAFT_213396 [Emiliania huxleyi CCMP1516]
MGLVRGLRSRAGYETPGETVAVADLATKLDGLEVDGEEPPPSIPAPPVRGLKNLGACERNTCFLNSVLQNLMAAEPLRVFLLQEPSAGEGPATVALRNWSRQMHDGRESTVAPSKVLQAVSRKHKRYSGRAQQDAQEVLRNLLELVRAEEVARLKESERRDAAVAGAAADAGGGAAGQQLVR